MLFLCILIICVKGYYVITIFKNNKGILLIVHLIVDQFQQDISSKFYESDKII
jgi:hypothetical protein